MPPPSTLKPVIMAKAIQLFGERGRYGVTIEALAQEAKVGKGSIYRLCGPMEELYDEALKEVTSRVQEQLSKMLVSIKNQNGRYYLGEAARQWYRSMRQQDARFLHQALIQDKTRHDQAYGPLGQLVTALAAVLERQSKGKAAQAREKVENVIWALFHYKLMRSSRTTAKQEMEEVVAKISHWLDDVLPER